MNASDDGDVRSKRRGTLSASPAPTIDDPEVIQQLEKYIGELEEGKHPDRQSLLDQYPAIGRELTACLDALELVHQTAPQLDGDASRAKLKETASLGTLGDFELKREIGRGGMGVVYEAEQISLHRRVALKVLPFAAVLDPKQLQRFKNEAQAAAGLDHPNIVSIYAVGCERGVHHYAMQFIDGRTLAEVIEELRGVSCERSVETPDDVDAVGEVTRQLISGAGAEDGHTPAGDEPTTDFDVDAQHATQPATETRRQSPTRLSGDTSTRSRQFFHAAARLGIQAAEALEHAHQMGVVHRDIKPSNLMVDAQGHLWVTDFGLAMTQTETNLTMTGDVLGTLRYMSPEQALARHGILDHHTDIYSLGVTLYELITLRPAFAAIDRQQLLHQISEEEPQRPRRLNGSVPKDLETILLKAMAKEPQARYATAQELADDLRRYAEDEPIRARRPSLAVRAQKWARRHRAAVWSMIAVLLVSVAAMGVGTFLVALAYQREQDLRKLAQEKAAEAESQRRRAENNLLTALKVLDEIYARIMQRGASDPPTSPEDDQSLWHSTLKFYESFAAEHSTAPEGEALVDGLYRRAMAIRVQLINRLPRAVGYQRGLATALTGFASARKIAGKDQDAEEAYRDAISIQEQLVGEYPTIPEYRRELSASHSELASLLKSMGRGNEADRCRQEAQTASRVRTLNGEVAAWKAVHFSDFRETNELVLVGDALVDDGRLRLTPADLGKVGGAWLSEKQAVAAGFETTFRFQMSGGADGFAFVIQNHDVSALGPEGGGLGYGDQNSPALNGIPNSLAVEFDTFFSQADVGELGKHISVHTNGTAPNAVHSSFSLGSATLDVDLDDGNSHEARIRYVPGSLSVCVDDSAEPALIVSVEIEGTLNLDAGRAWIGFTGATGGVAFQTHDILSWDYRPLAEVTGGVGRPFESPHALSEFVTNGGPALARFRRDREVEFRETASSGKEATPEGSQPSSSENATSLVDRLLTFYETFARQQSSNPMVRLEMGKAYWRTGEILKGERQMDRAARAWQSALELWEALGSDFPDRPEVRPYLARAYRWRGDSYAAQGNHEAAVAEYTRALEMAPSSTGVCYERAKSYSALRQHEDALADYDRHLRERPFHAQARCQRANLFVALDRHDEAFQDFTQFLNSKRPQSVLRREIGGYQKQLATACVEMADLMYSAGRGDEAAEAFSKAYDRALKTLESNAASTNDKIWLVVIPPARARLLIKLGRHEEALADLTKAVESSPDNAGVHRARGKLYLTLKRYDDALADFNKAIELRPDHADTCRELADLYVTTRQYQAALAVSDTHLRASSKNEATVIWECLRIEALLGLDRYEEAVAEATRAVEIAPENADAYRLRGNAYLKLKMYDESLADYIRGLELDPKPVPTNLNFIQYSSEAAPIRVAFLREAVAIYGKLAEENPSVITYHHGLAQSYRHLGEGHEDGGELDEAASFYRKAWEIKERLVRQEPFSNVLRGELALIHFMLGNVHEAKREYEEAAALYEKAIEIQEGLPADSPYVTTFFGGIAASYVALFKVYITMGNDGEAASLLDRLGAHLPESAEAKIDLAHTTNNLGFTYLRAHRYSQAEELFWPALRWKQEVVADSPGNAHYRYLLSFSYHDLADVFAATGRWDEAEEYFRQAIEIKEELVAGSPENAGYCWQLAWSYRQYAALLLSLDRCSEAEQQYRAALVLLEPFVRKSSGPSEPHNHFAAVSREYGEYLLGKGEFAEAAATAERVVELMPAEAAGYLEALKLIANCAVAAARDSDLSENERESEVRGCVERARRLSADAGALPKNTARDYNGIAWFLATAPLDELWQPDQAVALALKAVELEPGSQAIWNTLGVAQYRAGEWDEAARTLAKSMELRSGGDAFDWFFLAMAHWRRGDRDEAETWYHRAVQWMEQHRPGDEELLRFRAEAAELLGIAETPAAGRQTADPTEERTPETESPPAAPSLPVEKARNASE